MHYALHPKVKEVRERTWQNNILDFYFKNFFTPSSNSCPHSLSLSVKLLERVVYTHHPHFLTFHHSSNQCNMASVTMKLLLPRSTIIYMSVKAKGNS